MAITDSDHQRLLQRGIEADTRILATQFFRLDQIAVLIEKWTADAFRGMTAVFLTEQVAGIDDAALRRLLNEHAGMDLGEVSVTIVRRDEHVFLNFGFEEK